MESLSGLYPGEVVSYDAESRTCRVRIPGITDGSGGFPLAEIVPPIGDRSFAADKQDETELRILPGDLVWLMFEGGDPRFPLIMGARAKRAGNTSGWRRWRHANMELTADGELIINAAKLTIKVSGGMTTTVGGAQSTTVAGAMTAKAASSKVDAATLAITAATTVTGNLGVSGAMKNNDVNVGSTHTHTEQGDGANVSFPK